MQVDEAQARIAELNLEAPSGPPVSRNAPIVLLVMGMAGSGKTTFVHVSSDNVLDPSSLRSASSPT